MGRLERGPGAKLDMEVDVVAGPGAAGAELVVADHLRRPRGGDRGLDPVELLRGRGLVHAAPARSR